MSFLIKNINKKNFSIPMMIIFYFAFIFSTRPDILIIHHLPKEYKETGSIFLDYFQYRFSCVVSELFIKPTYFDKETVYKNVTFEYLINFLFNKITLSLELFEMESELYEIGNLIDQKEITENIKLSFDRQKKIGFRNEQYQMMLNVKIFIFFLSNFLLQKFSTNIKKLSNVLNLFICINVLQQLETPSSFIIGDIESQDDKPYYEFSKEKKPTFAFQTYDPISEFEEIKIHIPFETHNIVVFDFRFFIIFLIIKYFHTSFDDYKPFSDNINTILNIIFAYFYAKTNTFTFIGYFKLGFPQVHTDIINNLFSKKTIVQTGMIINVFSIFERFLEGKEEKELLNKIFLNEVPFINECIALKTRCLKKIVETIQSTHGKIAFYD